MRRLRHAGRSGTPCQRRAQSRRTRLTRWKVRDGTPFEDGGQRLTTAGTGRPARNGNGADSVAATLEAAAAQGFRPAPASTAAPRCRSTTSSRRWLSRPRHAPGGRGPAADRAGHADAADRFDRNGLRRRGRRRVRGGARAGGDGERRRSAELHRFSERFECRTCGIPYEDPQPRLFSFNNPFGACPDLPRVRQRHRARHGPRRARPGALDPGERDRAVEQAALPDLPGRPEARGAGARRPAGRAVGRPDRGGAAVRHRGRRRASRASAASSRWLERKKYKVHVRVFLSRYRGYQTCPDCGGARLRREARDVRVGGRTIDAVCALTVREAQRVLRGASRSASARRRSPTRCWPRSGAGCRSSSDGGPRLPDARPAVVDAVGRRVAADQPGDLARVGAGRHALRARRAVDRPASARQPAAHRDPPAAARPGEHACWWSSTTRT